MVNVCARWHQLFIAINPETTGRRIQINSVILLIWLLLFAVDTARVATRSKPVFAVCIGGADDGGSGEFYGLGYWCEIKRNFLPDGAPGTLPGVVKAEGRLFGIPYLNVSANSREQNDAA